MQVMVAMSGGVDSSVAAALLVEAGHEVVGVTMKLWGGESDTGCCSVADVDDARRVAQQLGIDHVVFNFTEDFDAKVVEPYVEAHRAGLTPNPCVECNRHLKFDRLLARADAVGFDAVATGHHCRIDTVDGHAVVARGADRAKDQSYVVHMLTSEQLGRLSFPVGTMDKTAVRAHAARLGLRTASKSDSQDVCFITSEAGRSGFLRRRLALTPGRMFDTAGRDVGPVDALELVTVGQRRGLDLGGGSDRRYAVGVDIVAGVVTVGSADDLVVAETPIHSLSWSTEAFATEAATTVLVQCSAHGAVAPAAVDRVGDVAVVRWSSPHRRVAPGQAVVFYDESNTFVVGSAVVSATPSPRSTAAIHH
jgi:tRNA-uridine 2-sulfurtransferase